MPTISSKLTRVATVVSVVVCTLTASLIVARWLRTSQAAAIADDVRCDERAKRAAPLLLSEVRKRSAGALFSSTASFTLKNTATEERRVVLLSRSCTCIAVMHDGQPLNPDDSFIVRGASSSPLDLTVNVRPVVNEQSFTFECATPTASGVEHKLGLEYVVPVVADAECLPDSIRHDFRLGEKHFQQTVSLRAMRRGVSPAFVPPKLGGLPTGTTIASVKCSGPPEPVAPDLWRQEWTIEATVNPIDTSSLAETSGAISITFPGLEDGLSQTTYLPVIVRSRSGIESPRVVHLGSVTSGVTSTRRVQLRAADDQPFLISKIDCDSPRVTVSGSIGQPAKSHWLEIVLVGQAHGRHSSVVTIRTSHVLTPVVTINVTADVE